MNITAISFHSAGDEIPPASNGSGATGASDTTTRDDVGMVPIAEIGMRASEDERGAILMTRGPDGVRARIIYHHNGASLARTVSEIIAVGCLPVHQLRRYAEPMVPPPSADTVSGLRVWRDGTVPLVHVHAGVVDLYTSTQPIGPCWRLPLRTCAHLCAALADERGGAPTLWGAEPLIAEARVGRVLSEVRHPTAVRASVHTDGRGWWIASTGEQSDDGPTPTATGSMEALERYAMRIRARSVGRTPGGLRRLPGVVLANRTSVVAWHMGAVRVPALTSAQIDPTHHNAASFVPGVDLEGVRTAPATTPAAAPRFYGAATLHGYPEPDEWPDVRAEGTTIGGYGTQRGGAA